MPLFEYACQTCGQVIEVLQRDASVRATCGSDCVGAGRGQGVLVRKLSPHAVLSGASAGPACATPSMCGGCDGVPGSCGET